MCLMKKSPTTPQYRLEMIPLANPKLYNLDFMLGYSTNRLTKAQLSLETNQDKTNETDKNEKLRITTRPKNRNIAD